MRSAAALGVTEFYECGPDAALAGMAKRIDKSLSVKSFSKWEDVNA
jgi:malonyl CoA-acyl carrier protein transacylase